MTRHAAGLFVGRFQPFHNGHMEAIQYTLTTMATLVVGIAAVDRNLTLTDPFTCGERIQMIWASLSEAERTRCLVLPIADQVNNVLWAEYVRQLVPPFQVVFTNNALQAATMTRAGYEVRPIPYSNRREFAGARIRRLLAENDDEWQRCVPNGSASVLTRMDATGRVAQLQIASGS